MRAKITVYESSAGPSGAKSVIMGEVPPHNPASQLISITTDEGEKVSFPIHRIHKIRWEE